MSDSSTCSALPHTAWSLVTWILAGTGGVPAYFTLPTMSPARTGAAASAAMTVTSARVVRGVFIVMSSFLEWGTSLERFLSCAPAGRGPGSGLRGRRAATLDPEREDVIA